MLIVSGKVYVAPDARDDYVAAFRDVVARARA